MRTVRASLELLDAQAECLEHAAEFFGMTEQQFLNACLRDGIAQAESFYVGFLQKKNSAWDGTPLDLSENWTAVPNRP